MDKDLNFIVVEVSLDKMYSFMISTIKNQHVKHVNSTYAVADLFYTPSDPMYHTQWHLNKINCPTAWDQTTGSADLIIAILDTGVDYNHPDLKDNMYTGYDFADDDSDPLDCQGHGTMLAGVAAAAVNNILGCGVAPRVKIMPVKVFRKVQTPPGGCSSLFASNSGVTEDISQLFKGF